MRGNLWSWKAVEEKESVVPLALLQMKVNSYRPHFFTPVLSSVDDFDKFKNCKNTSIFNTVYGLEASKGSSRLIDVPKGCTLSLWCPLLAFIPSSALLAPATNRNTQSNLMLPPSCLTTRKVFVCWWTVPDGVLIVDYVRQAVLRVLRNDFSVCFVRQENLSPRALRVF